MRERKVAKKKGSDQGGKSLDNVQKVQTRRGSNKKTPFLDPAKKAPGKSRKGKSAKTSVVKFKLSSPTSNTLLDRERGKKKSEKSTGGGREWFASTHPGGESVKGTESRVTS